MAATLVFAHGSGFCKQMWQPVIRRIQQSQFAAQVTAGAGFECHETCLPLHGEKHDPHAHEGAVVYYEGGDERRPRVRLPNGWPVGVERELYPEFKALRDRCGSGEQRRPLIGIGHSMGAAMLWTVEARDPGMFDGLILFEPPYVQLTPAFEESIDFMVSMTLQREHEWPNMKAVSSFFESHKSYASWDREVLHHYVEGAIVSSNGEAKAKLAYHPLIEAAVYGSPCLTLSEDELASPKCPAHLLYGSKSRFFNASGFQSLADRHSFIYSVGDPMPGLGHLMVFQDPEMSSRAIVSSLEALLGNQASENVIHH